MSIRVVVQPEAKGMGDALLQAAPALPSRPGTALYVVQVHDVVDDQLHSDMLNAYQKPTRPRPISPGYEREDYFPGGYLIVSPTGASPALSRNRARTIVRAIWSTSSRTSTADADELLDAIRAEYAKDIPDRRSLRARDGCADEEARLPRRAYRGAWKALKYPWHVLDVMEYFLSQIQGQVVAESAIHRRERRR